MDLTALYVLLVVFLATLVRSTFGFGEALFAVPLLALRVPLAVATPLAVLLSITIAAAVVAQDFRSVHVRSAGWLLFATLFGIPLGLLLLTEGHERLLKGSLGCLIFLFAIYFLLGKKPPELGEQAHVALFVCGFLAGVLGGAYGMNGPPLVMYGAMRRWSPQQFRATLQGYFLPASLIGMAGYTVAGMWTLAVTRYYLLSLIAVVPAIFLGRFINRRLRGEAFLHYVYVALAVIGAALLGQALYP
jgi:uncharacterized membrane protein YfcA